MISPGAAPQYITDALTPPRTRLQGAAMAAVVVLSLGTPSCWGGLVGPNPFAHRLQTPPGDGGLPEQVINAELRTENTDGATRVTVTGAGPPNTPLSATSTFRSVPVRVSQGT